MSKSLNADHLHVILDALQYAAFVNMPEHFSESYEGDPADDPKVTPEGWERTRAEAAQIVGDNLSAL